MLKIMTQREMRILCATEKQNIIKAINTGEVCVEVLTMKSPTSIEASFLVKWHYGKRVIYVPVKRGLKDGIVHYLGQAYYEGSGHMYKTDIYDDIRAKGFYNI